VRRRRMKNIENVSLPRQRAGFPARRTLASEFCADGARFNSPGPLWAGRRSGHARAFQPSPWWMSIASDGTSPSSPIARRWERQPYGAARVADELDADCPKENDQAVAIRNMATKDTDGSHSVRSSFD